MREEFYLSVCMTYGEEMPEKGPYARAVDAAQAFRGLYPKGSPYLKAIREARVLKADASLPGVRKCVAMIDLERRILRMNP